MNTSRVSLSFSHLLWELFYTPIPPQLLKQRRICLLNYAFEIPLPGILANSMPAREKSMERVSALQLWCCRNHGWKVEAAVMKCMPEQSAWVKIYYSNSLCPLPVYLLLELCFMHIVLYTEKHVELSIFGRHGEKSCLKNSF